MALRIRSSTATQQYELVAPQDFRIRTLLLSNNSTGCTLSSRAGFGDTSQRVCILRVDQSRSSCCQKAFSDPPFRATNGKKRLAGEPRRSSRGTSAVCLDLSSSILAHVARRIAAEPPSALHKTRPSLSDWKVDHILRTPGQRKTHSQRRMFPNQNGVFETIEERELFFSSCIWCRQLHLLAVS